MRCRAKATSIRGGSTRAIWWSGVCSDAGRGWRKGWNFGAAQQANRADRAGSLDPFTDASRLTGRRWTEDER